MKSKASILVIDDDRAVCTSLNLLLKRAGFQVDICHYPRDARPFLQKQRPDLIILDMNFTIDTSGKQGMNLLGEIQEMHPGLPVILMTGWGTLHLAVQGMKAGARDFLTKPWDNQELLDSIESILSLSQPVPDQSERSPGFDHIIGADPGFLEIIQIARRVSKTQANVLILGESGTGKELLAEAIHYESNRADQAFVKVNLGGISSSLFESEMFGHKRGAFTGAVADRVGRFERADKGTIFLDEIGDLDLSAQVKLLRVLQEKTFEVLGSSTPRKVDVRVISATNKNLEKMVADQDFREDLFYRINLITLKIPSLSERKGDIPLLVRFYVNNLKEIYQLPDLEVSKRALNWLEAQSFPGNIRQLKNLVERTVLVAQKNRLEKEDFVLHHHSQKAGEAKTILPRVGEISLEELERQMVLKAMQHHQHNVSQAARSLGLTRSALYRRLAKFNIPHEP